MIFRSWPYLSIFVVGLILGFSTQQPLTLSTLGTKIVYERNIASKERQLTQEQLMDGEFMLNHLYILSQSDDPRGQERLKEIFDAPEFWTRGADGLSSGDRASFDISLLGYMKNYRDLGFDFSKLSGGAVDTLTKRFDWKTLSKHYPDVIKLYGLQPPAGYAPPQKSAEVKSALAKIALDYYENVLPELVEESLEDLKNLHSCFQSLQADEAETTDFCQYIHDVHKVTLPSEAVKIDPKTKQPLKAYQSRPEVFGNCSMDISVSFLRTNIVNGHETPSNEQAMSIITVRSWPELKGGPKIIPLYKFLEAVQNFCGPIVVENRDSKNKRHYFFNTTFKDFERMFLPPGAPKEANSSIETSVQ